MVLDINNFKKINDKHGHEYGDKTLQIVSKIILSSVRKTDIVARWGGDEFLVICPKADKDETKKILSRVIEDKYGTNIGLSAGMALFPYDGETLDKLINAADRKMYKSKDINKSCICAYEDFELVH
ncbi:diguanylate cyclase [Bacillus sp. 1NLA3E]|nr:diguanylate cyclase [Bacillus sp. 1NLA3E]